MTKPEGWSTWNWNKTHLYTQGNWLANKKPDRIAARTRLFGEIRVHTYILYALPRFLCLFELAGGDKLKKEGVI
jgi:hypothetical protein